VTDILRVEKLAVGYGHKAILEQIDFSVSPGEFISVIAPNGAGKSTLLKTVAGVLPPLAGTVYLGEKLLNTYSRRSLAQQIAIVGMEKQAPDYTVGKMVLLGRYPHMRLFHGPTDTDQGIAGKALETIELYHKRLCLFNELSQGERQKVLIARALAQQPRLLLLDEPTAHLDISNQFVVLKLIKKLVVEEKLAVLAVIHDVNLALHFSSKLLFLKDGQVIAYGNPDEVATTENLKRLYGMDFTIHGDAAATYVRPSV